MPFGLRNAPATFSRLVTKVFKGLAEVCEAYLEVVSVLPGGRLLAPIFSTLSCFPPFSLVPHTTILSETRSAYPIVSCPLVSFPIIRPSISYLTSHILGKSREVVSRCLPPGVFTETPSLVSVSFTIRPSSSLFRDVGFAYTGENSVVHHALSFNRGTTCRWRGGQLGGRGFLRHMPPFR